MARPRKKGLDYFPHDVDAASDEKLIAMRAVHGNEGYAFYFMLLERIYRTDEGAMDISSKVWEAALLASIGIAKSGFDDMMRTAVEIGLFDKKSFDDGIITSNGIRSRFDIVNKQRKDNIEKYARRKENMSLNVSINL